MLQENVFVFFLFFSFFSSLPLLLLGCNSVVQWCALYGMNDGGRERDTKALLCAVPAYVVKKLGITEECCANGSNGHGTEGFTLEISQGRV